MNFTNRSNEGPNQQTEMLTKIHLTNYYYLKNEKISRNYTSTRQLWGDLVPPKLESARRSFWEPADDLLLWLGILDGSILCNSKRNKSRTMSKGTHNLASKSLIQTTQHNNEKKMKRQSYPCKWKPHLSNNMTTKQIRQNKSRWSQFRLLLPKTSHFTLPLVQLLSPHSRWRQTINLPQSGSQFSCWNRQLSGLEWCLVILHWWWFGAHHLPLGDRGARSHSFPHQKSALQSVILHQWWWRRRWTTPLPHFAFPPSNFHIHINRALPWHPPTTPLFPTSPPLFYTITKCSQVILRFARINFSSNWYAYKRQDSEKHQIPRITPIKKPRSVNRSKDRNSAVRKPIGPSSFEFFWFLFSFEQYSTMGGRKEKKKEEMS